jgi:hypothetical protein
MVTYADYHLRGSSRSIPLAAVTGLLHEISSGFEMRDRLEITNAFRLSSKPVTWGDADEVHAV